MTTIPNTTLQRQFIYEMDSQTAYRQFDRVRTRPQPQGYAGRHDLDTWVVTYDGSGRDLHRTRYRLRQQVIGRRHTAAELGTPRRAES